MEMYLNALYKQLLLFLKNLIREIYRKFNMHM